MSYSRSECETQAFSNLTHQPPVLQGKPKGPFPYLVASQPLTRRHTVAHPHPVVLNRFQKTILEAMGKGAHLLFDTEAKRGLLYSFRRGVAQLAELSIRTLAAMVKEGLLHVSGHEGRLIHYALGPAY